MTREDRLSLAREIAARAKALHTDQLLAVGIYGSTARGTDGPYSDLEMLCVLRTADEDYSHEWCAGPWKTEVNFRSENVVLREAAAVDERWPLTHGSFVVIHSLHDPDGFFPRLRRAVESPEPEVFDRVIEAAIVGELYEWIGKLRNAMASGQTAHLPELAVNLAKYGALILGLAHRHLYTSGAKVFEEALALPGRPPGYDELCRLVMRGALADPAEVSRVCEGFWGGVVVWAKGRGLDFVETRRIPF